MQDAVMAVQWSEGGWSQCALRWWWLDERWLWRRCGWKRRWLQWLTEAVACTAVRLAAMAVRKKMCATEMVIWLGKMMTMGFLFLNQFPILL
ncbi:hypothetical protein SESBI_50502, partial [Sesbania bispinosa]